MRFQPLKHWLSYNTPKTCSLESTIANGLGGLYFTLPPLIRADSTRTLKLQGLSEDCLRSPSRLPGQSELSKQTSRTVQVSEQSPRTVHLDHTQIENKNNNKHTPSHLRGVRCAGAHYTSHIAPLSTPRAMAHGSGWGCCCGGLLLVAPPAIYPMSSGS